MRSHTPLFFEAMPPRHTSPFSVPLHEENLLRALCRNRSIWVVGNSCRVREGLEPLGRVLEPIASEFRHVHTSLCETDLPLVKKLAARLCAHNEEPLLILAEEDYGPAFGRLCSVAPAFMPVLLPSGYLVPTLPQAMISPTHPEGTTTRHIDATLEDMGGARIAIWCTHKQYTYSVRPVLSSYGAAVAIAGIVSDDPASQGRECHGHVIRTPEALADMGYDAIVSCMDDSQRVYGLMHQYAYRLTPVVLLNQNDLLSAATFAHRRFAAVPEFSGRTYYNPFLTEAKYRTLFADHPDFSPEHFACVSKTNLPLTIGKSVFRHADVQSRYFTIRNGERLTAHTRPEAGRSMHVLGPSYALCSLCDDAHTVASHVQELCNEAAPERPAHERYAVRNHGVAGNTMENMFRQLRTLSLKPGDVAIIVPPFQQYGDCRATLLAMHAFCRERGAECAVFFQPSLFAQKTPSRYERILLDEYRKLNGLLFEIPESVRRAFDIAPLCRSLTAEGVPAFSLQSCVERPHDLGEVFVDVIHVTHKGNRAIARGIFTLLASTMSALEKAHRTTGAVNTISRETLQAADREFIRVVRDRFITNPSFIDWLDAVPRFSARSAQSAQTGAIVMNCNPFTLGHLHIIREALARVERLYIFAVEEDVSDFAFSDRLAMIRQGVAQFGDRVLVIPSGTFIISSFTFPEYFSKETLHTAPDTSMEIALFGSLIAPALGVSVRFFGEEPFCEITRAHHAQLKELLPLCGVECVEIPRLRHGATAISASNVRRVLRDQRMEELSGMVPVSTLRYLRGMLQDRESARTVAAVPTPSLSPPQP